MSATLSQTFLHNVLSTKIFNSESKYDSCCYKFFQYDVSLVMRMFYGILFSQPYLRSSHDLRINFNRYNRKQDWGLEVNEYLVENADFKGVFSILYIISINYENIQPKESNQITFSLEKTYQFTNVNDGIEIFLKGLVTYFFSEREEQSQQTDILSNQRISKLIILDAPYSKIIKKRLRQVTHERGHIHQERLHQTSQSNQYSQYTHYHIIKLNSKIGGLSNLYSVKLIFAQNLRKDIYREVPLIQSQLYLQHGCQCFYHLEAAWIRVILYIVLKEFQKE